MIVLLALSLATAGLGQDVDAASNDQANARVCKTQITTGTLVPHVVCKSLAQWWEEQRTDDRDQAELVAEYGVRTLNSWED